LRRVIGDVGPDFVLSWPFGAQAAQDHD
jgi:hypothetical protein